MNQRLVIIGGVIIALLIAVFSILYVAAGDPTEQEFRRLSENPLPSRDIDEDVLAEIVYSEGEEGAVLRQGELSFEQIVALLRQKYGENIDRADVRTAMLEELMRFLRARYPDRWVEVLQEILLAAFPDRAAELFQLSENLYRYAREIDERRDLLGRMSRAERQAMLRDIRRQYFGEEADEIWAAEIRMQKVADTLEAIRGSDLSLREKLSAYTRSLDEAFGERLASVPGGRRLNLVQEFTDVVQEDLAELEPEERYLALRQIREGLGMDVAAIDRWEDLDRRRDARWNAGRVYTQRRDGIVAGCTGDCSSELNALRREVFGEEADIIAEEEAAGFFRYRRQQRFGRD